MESPTTTIKQAIQPGTIIKVTLGLVIVFALFDVLGFTDWILYPYSSIKAKFFPGK